MLRRFFGCIGCFALLAGVVLLPLDAQEKSASPVIVAKLKGHTDAVYAVAYSPDGKFLATASFDNTIKLWNAATGKEIKTYGGAAGHKQQVICVAFSPDGATLASGSTDTTLKTWDVPVNAPIRSLKLNDAARSVALSPDGTKLAIGSKDGSMKLVTPADFKEIVKFEPGHQGAITGLAFSANGQLLASTGADRTLRYWNVLTGQLQSTIGAHKDSANSVVVNPNGTAAYTIGDDGFLKFWSVTPPASKTLPGHTAPIRVMALAPDGAQYCTGGDDKTVRQFAIAGAKEVRALTGPAASITSVAGHPANAFIAAGTQDSRIYLWNGADGKPLVNWLAHAGAVDSVQVQPAGQQLMSAGADGMVKFWAVPPVPPRTLTHPDAVLVALATPDSKKVYTGSGDKIVRLWDATKQAVEKQFMGHAGPVTALAVSPNQQILASGSADNTIRLWNQTTAKEFDILLAHTAPVTALGINAAGTQMLSASEDGTVKLWQLPIVTPKTFLHPDAITRLVLTPDGAKALTGGGDKIVRLWNLTTGAKERDYPGLTLPVTSLAVSGNGATVAAGSADKTVTLWNVADAKVLKKLPMPAIPQGLAFSADAQSVFVALADGGIKQIKIADGKDAKDGKDIKDFGQPKGAVVGLALSPKGDMLYSAGADKMIQAWSVPAGAAKAKFVHDAPITAMTLSKDGTRLAAVAGKSVKVWTAADSKEVGSMKLPADGVAIGLSPDNTRVIIACTDKLARICALDGKLLEILPHDGAVSAAMFVDAKRTLTAGADKLARLWTSALLWRQAHAGPIRQAAFTTKGDQVISAGDDKTIRLWNVADGKELKSLNNENLIASLSLSADGTKIASAGADKVVKIWTLADGKVSATIVMPAAVQSLSFSPNGQRVAMALADGPTQVIRVHDLGLGKDLQILADHTAPLRSLQFLGDGRTLVTASLDKTARLLDVGIVSALVAHPPGPMFAQYHANGTQLLTAGADKTIKLWDLQKSSVIKSFGPVADPIRAATFSKDFTRVGVATGKAVKVWNVADGTATATLQHRADVLSLSFSQDGTRIATGAADKQTRLWDVATGKELQFFPQDAAVEAVIMTSANNLIISAAGKVTRLDAVSILRSIVADAGAVRGLALLPANTHVLTAGADKTVKLWNVASGAPERTFAGATAPLWAVAVSKNGLLVAAGGADKTVRAYSFADGKEIGAVNAATEVRALAFTANSLALVVALTDKRIAAWDVPFTPGQPAAPEFLRPAQSFDTAGMVADLTIAADSASIYGAAEDKAMHVWKLASSGPTRNFPHGVNVDAVAFQPNGPLLASTGHDGKLRFYDLAKNAQAKDVSAHISIVAKQNVPNPIYALNFTPDGKQILTASYDSSIKLWDVAGGKLIREFKPFKEKEFAKGHQEPIYSAALSPDGKFIASGSSGLERTIKIWNVGDGTVVRDLVNPAFKTSPPFPAASHPGAVTGLRFTKDGQYLVSVGDAPGNKGYLAVWDWQSGKLLTSDTLQLGVFYSLAIAPDGKTIAVTAGNRDRKYASPDYNTTYLIKLPMLGK